MKKRFFIILVSIFAIAVILLIVNILIPKKKENIIEKPSTPLIALYNKAKETETAGNYLDARGIYEEVFEKSQDELLTQGVQKDLLALNMKILFSPLTTEDSVIYKVKEGDTLGKIAKKYKTTVDLIMKSNNLKSDLIRINQDLKISTASYSIVVDRSQNILTLKANENVLKTYTVSTGINNCTPVGTFKIVNKLKDPVWYKAGAIVSSGSSENILGSRWMGISVSGYGIHGTTQPEDIGKHVTAGCIRMKEPEVQELYAIMPVGSEVTILD